MYLVFFIFDNADLATSESEGGICPTENGNIMYKNTDVKEGLEDVQEQFYAYCDIVGSCKDHRNVFFFFVRYQQHLSSQAVIMDVPFAR